MSGAAIAAVVPVTQWIIALASLGSALIALALAFGLKEWVLRPKVRLVLRHPAIAEEISDRVVTQRIDSGEPAAFVRLRLANQGRSTARNVGVRVLQVYKRNGSRQEWIRSRPELDGRLLQPSNQLPSEPNLVDVFPSSDRIVDLASVGYGSQDGANPVLVEIGHPRPPNKANALEPGTWRLELLICGDNINAQRYFVTVSFDGTRCEEGDLAIWDHFRVEAPVTRRRRREG